MARIRTIKPEFPQSESMGRVSRESRLCFILLWTLADDAGRLRGNSRMLASLLYPYDDDAKDLMEGWLTELANEGCIQRYEIDGNQYVQIAKWLTHQRIDKPSQSKIPAFDEASRIVAKPREPSATDLGPRTKDQDNAPDGAALELDSEFAEWWEQYPHKVDKAAAQRAYRKARKKASRETLLTGLEAYKRTKEDWRAWKGPAAWLNGERWNDAPAGASATPAPAGDETIRQNVKAWLATGANPRAMKFPPGHPDCKIPKHILLEFRDELKQHGYEVAA